MPDGGSVRESWADWDKAVLDVRRVVTLAGLVRRAHAAESEALAALRRFPDPSIVDMTDEELLREIGRGVSALVTSKLVNVPWAIDNEAVLREDGDPTLYLLAARPSNTIGYAYFLIADLLAARAELRRCEGCGRLY